MTDIDGMARLSICGIGLVLASVVMFAQTPTGSGPGPILGIVEIPDMFSFDPNTGEYAPPRSSLRLFVQPNWDSKVFANISSREAIDDAGFSHEGNGALVYGRENGYFLIRTSRGAAWLSPHNAGSFHPYEDLVSGDLSYVTEAWDGFVSESPGSALRTRMPQRQPQGEVARVKGFRTVRGKLWVEIEVISHSFCESDEPPKIKARGWIAAHDKANVPTVWFAARGC